MAEGNWTQTFPSLIEHTKARGADINSRVSGLGSNYDMLPAPHDDGKKGFFGPCYVGSPTELGQATSAVDIRNGAITHGVDSGVADAYVVTLGIASLAYVAGMKVNFVATTTNTGTSTIDIDGLGVIALKASATMELPADYIYVDDIVEVIYTGTFFQITSITSHVADAANSAAAAAVSETNAATSETNAASSEGVCLASSNFIGEWSDQTGAHVIPTSVSNDDKYWMLIADVVDITLSEPGVSADWVEIKAGGGMAWEASASGDVTAVASIGYLTYTDTAARNVNLPAGVVGESVGINDVSQNCGTNSITVITSGSEKFMGLVENFILDIDGSSIVATYADATNGWVITGGNW